MTYALAAVAYAAAGALGGWLLAIACDYDDRGWAAILGSYFGPASLGIGAAAALMLVVDPKKRHERKMRRLEQERKWLEDQRKLDQELDRYIE